MPHACGEPRLVEEHGDELGLLGVLLVELLDGDDATTVDLPETAGEIDRRHSTGRDLVEHRVTVRPDETALH